MESECASRPAGCGSLDFEPIGLQNRHLPARIFQHGPREFPFEIIC